MLKRIADEMQATNSPAGASPEKKVHGFQLKKTQSPTKEYFHQIVLKEIVDPETKELLGITLENCYPLLSWIKGETGFIDHEGEEIFVPAQGKYLSINLRNIKQFCKYSKENLCRSLIYRDRWIKTECIQRSISSMLGKKLQSMKRQVALNQISKSPLCGFFQWLPMSTTLIKFKC